MLFLFGRHLGATFCCLYAVTWRVLCGLLSVLYLCIGALLYPVCRLQCSLSVTTYRKTPLIAVWLHQCELCCMPPVPETYTCKLCDCQSVPCLAILGALTLQRLPLQSYMALFTCSGFDDDCCLFCFEILIKYFVCELGFINLVTL